MPKNLLEKNGKKDVLGKVAIYEWKYENKRHVVFEGLYAMPERLRKSVKIGSPRPDVFNLLFMVDKTYSHDTPLVMKKVAFGVSMCAVIRRHDLVVLVSVAL